MWQEGLLTSDKPIAENLTGTLENVSVGGGGDSLASSVIQAFKYRGHGLGSLLHRSDTLLQKDKKQRFSLLGTSKSQRVSLVAGL